MAAKVKEEAKSETALMTQSDSQAMQELLQENLGGMTLSPDDLVKVQIPTGGATTWEIPTGEGDEVDAVRAITGTVIAQMPMRLAFNGEKQLVCKSEDAITGNPTGESFDGLTPSGNCANCPLNKWGSKGRGKACADKMRLYVMRDDDVLPILITLPPTSLAAWRKYVISLATSTKKSYHAVKTNITLKKIAQDGRDPYSIVQFGFNAHLDEGESAYLDTFRIDFMGMLKASIEQSDTPQQADWFEQADKAPKGQIVDDVPTF